LKQGTLFDLEEELSRLEEERINQLASDINKIKNSYEISKERFEKSESKRSISRVLSNIKENADPIGLLPSAKTMQKHYDNLNKLSEVSGLSLENHDDSVFLQNFYGVFFKAPTNGISKSKKEEILKNSNLLKETVLFFKKLDDAQNLSREDLKDIVSIYKLKVENGEEKAESLIEKYKNSSLFKQNMKEIVAIYKTSIEFGKDFDFINRNIISLLAQWIVLKSSTKFKHALVLEMDLKNFLIGQKGEKEIDLELWAYGKILTNNLAESKKTKVLKENISSNFTKKFGNKFLKLQSPSKKDKPEFDNLISRIHNEKERVLQDLTQTLQV
jgi:hypothetical protein